MQEIRGSHDCHTLKEHISLSELLSLISSSFLPKQNYSLDQLPEADAFKEHVKNCEDNLKKIASIVDCQKDKSVFDKKLIINIILLCGEHSKEELWTSKHTIAYAESLLGSILDTRESVENLFIRLKIDLVLAQLRPKLLKDTWKDYPAAVACFMWLLFHIKCPHLGETLNSVMPTCLLLIDDHVYSNKIKGLQCVEHVVNNVSRADLNQYGRGSVIYNALEHMIYLREPEIIPPLGACLTAFLSKTEHRANNLNLSWNHFDDVLNIWLPSMEMEQKLLLREAYIKSLNSLLEAMGLASVRWSKKLLDIISEYVEQDQTAELALLCLLTFIKTTWPRLSFNVQPIMVIILKVVIKVQIRPDYPNPQTLLELVNQCSSILETICREELNSFLSDLDNDLLTENILNDFKKFKRGL